MGQCCFGPWLPSNDRKGGDKGRVPQLREGCWPGRGATFSEEPRSVERGPAPSCVRPSPAPAATVHGCRRVPKPAHLKEGWGLCRAPPWCRAGTGPQPRPRLPRPVLLPSLRFGARAFRRSPAHNPHLGPRFFLRMRPETPLGGLTELFFSRNWGGRLWILPQFPATSPYGLNICAPPKSIGEALTSDVGDVCSRAAQ